MAGSHVGRCFLAAFFDAGTDMFTSLTLAANMIRLLCVVIFALAVGLRGAPRMAGRHIGRCFLAAFFDAGTDTFTSLTVAVNVIRRMAGLSLC